MKNDTFRDIMLFIIAIELGLLLLCETANGQSALHLEAQWEPYTPANHADSLVTKLELWDVTGSPGGYICISDSIPLHQTSFKFYHHKPETCSYFGLRACSHLNSVFSVFQFYSSKEPVLPDTTRPNPPQGFSVREIDPDSTSSNLIFTIATTIENNDCKFELNILNSTGFPLTATTLKIHNGAFHRYWNHGTPIDIDSDHIQLADPNENIIGFINPFYPDMTFEITIVILQTTYIIDFLQTDRNRYSASLKI
jgi:hypothetical protein